MPQIAGLRGVLPEPSKLNEVLGKPVQLAPQLAAGACVRDPSKAVYRYHQTFAGPGGRSWTRKMVVCALRLTPFADGEVRPHELTPPGGPERALTQIAADHGHGDPVLAGFRDPATEVERLFRKVESARATIEHATADGTVHRLWRVVDSELLGKLRHYFAPKPLHLLDGHDRYEAMLAYRDQLSARAPLSMYSAGNYGLACLVSLDDPALFSAARHRVLRGEPAASATVLAALKQHFIVEPIPGAGQDVGAIGKALATTHAHQPAFALVFAGEPDAWKLTLSPDVSLAGEGVTIDRAIQRLDPFVVEHLVIERAFKAAEVSTETDARLALAALGTGAHVALIMRPLSVEQIAQVGERGQLLPARSTAFHPPLLAGLVSLVIDPDEDLV